MYYKWASNLVASSTWTGTFSWHCWDISCFCRGSSEQPFEKFASSFCISTESLFALLTFSSFTMFIFLRLVVTGFALFLTLKLFWLAMWSTFLDFSPLSLFLAIVRPLIPWCSFLKFQVMPSARARSSSLLNLYPWKIYSILPPKILYVVRLLMIESGFSV